MRNKQKPSGTPGRGSYWILLASSAALQMWAALLVITMPLQAQLVGGGGFIAALAAVRKFSVVPAGLLGGVAADRMDRRKLVAFASSMIVLSLVAVVVVGERNPVILMVCAATIGAGNVVGATALRSMIKQTVAKEHHHRAHAHNNSAELFGLLFASFVGPVLFGAAEWVPMAVGAVLAVGSGWLALTLPAIPRVPAENEGSTTGRGQWWGPLKDGLLHIWENPTLRAIELSYTAVQMAIGIQSGVLVVYATEWLGLDAGGFGHLMSISTIVAMVASLQAPRLMRRVEAKWLIRGSLVVFAAMFVGVNLTHSVPQSFALQGVFGVANGVMTAVLSATRQEATKDAFLGRVDSVSRVGAAGLPALSALLGGFVAQQFGIEWVLRLTAGSCVLVALLMWGPLGGVEHPKPKGDGPEPGSAA